MAAVMWALLRSWHAVRNGKTRCGRPIPAAATLVSDLPSGAKSCESCLRLVARDADL